MALDGYRVSGNKEHSSDTDVRYLGFLNKSGEWYFIEIDTGDGTILYARGSSGYSTAWTNRESLDYYLFNEVFR